MTTVRLLVLAAAVAVLAAAAPAAAYEDECSQFPTCAQCLNVTSAGVLAGRGCNTHLNTPKAGHSVWSVGAAWLAARGRCGTLPATSRLPPPPPPPLPSSLCALRLAAVAAVDLCRCPFVFCSLTRRRRLLPPSQDWSAPTAAGAT